MKKHSMKKISKEPRNEIEFDEYFENNDITHLLDTKPMRINVDLPKPMLARLDAKAHQLGMTRQAIIKYWIAEHLHMA